MCCQRVGRTVEKLAQRRPATTVVRPDTTAALQRVPRGQLKGVDLKVVLVQGEGGTSAIPSDVKLILSSRTDF